MLASMNSKISLREIRCVNWCQFLPLHLPLLNFVVESRTRRCRLRLNVRLMCRRFSYRRGSRWRNFRYRCLCSFFHCLLLSVRNNLRCSRLGRIRTLRLLYHIVSMRLSRLFVVFVILMFLQAFPDLAYLVWRIILRLTISRDD
jgi:hypothetical protein